MAEIKRIGILTSGGDSPGMNAAIRSAVRVALKKGIEPYGIYKGFAGLLDDNMKLFNSRDVSDIMQRGGTILETARCEEFKMDRGQEEAVKVVKRRGLDGIIVIGGNGSFAGALALSGYDIPTVGIPGTIDNDIAGTDMCIGVDTVLNTVVEAIGRIKDTASALERAFIVETMGRESGYIALISGLVSGAEAIIIPEIPVDEEFYDKMADKLLEGKKQGKKHCIIVVAEGAASAYTVARHLENKTGYEMRVTVLGHLQRGGSPTAYDRLIASRFGADAVEALVEGYNAHMIGMQGNKIVRLPLEKVVKNSKGVNLELYELAMELI